MTDMTDLSNHEMDTVLVGGGLQLFRCNCGKEFNVTGYPIGYKFACPRCNAFCTVTEKEGELRRGMVLGDFVAEKKIGLGGMGVVYLGRQLSLDRPVAIKVLRPSAANDEKFIHRLSREARTAAQIIHNNIVQIYYVGKENNIFFIAMEYVDGKSVRQLIYETKGISERQAIDIILQASEGLAKAHTQNILHRDVEVSFASDIYALGATLYHMVTSKLPFSGNLPAAIIAKHVTDYPRSPREINPALSKGLCHLIQKMMAKRPEDRISSMEEVIHEIRLLKQDKTRTVPGDGAHWFIEERDDTSRFHEMMTIVEVNRVISREKNLDRLLFRIVHEITLAINAERSTLYLYDPDKREIWAKIAEGIESDRVIHLPLGKGVAGTVAQSLKTEVINDDVYGDPRFNREVDEWSGFRTSNMICMPILGSQLELLGVIQVLNKKKGDFNHKDESLLSALAVNVGLALEKSRYFCARKPECKEISDNS